MKYELSKVHYFCVSSTKMSQIEPKKSCHSSFQCPPWYTWLNHKCWFGEVLDAFVINSFLHIESRTHAEEAEESKRYTLRKSVQIRSFFWSVFSCIRTEVNLRIQSEYGKIRTRKNFVFRHFSRSDYRATYDNMNPDVFLQK